MAETTAQDTRAVLEATNLDLLTEVVRKDQDSSALDVTDWSVRPLSDKGVINPDGLWLFAGHGRDAAGSRSWSVALKLLARAEVEGSLESVWYWKRELEVVRSDLSADLPAPLRAPRVYLAQETSAGAALWMEHVRDWRAGRWPLETFAEVARGIGFWNGSTARRESPGYPWLCRSHYRTFLSWVNPEQELRDPLFTRHTSPADRARYERLWSEREKLFSALDRLPLLFSHFDTQRRNLLHAAREGAQEELVMLDWAQCGLGPLGAEVACMVGSTALVLEWPPEQLQVLESAVFPAYLRGLREAGWTGNVEDVRLGYVGWLAGILGCTMPGMIWVWCAPRSRAMATKLFGAAEEELVEPFLHLMGFTLNRADEAFALIGR